MSPETLVDFDLRCIRCDYNLRGLPVVHRCPECEFPALRSYLSDVAGLPVRSRSGGRLISIRKACIVLAGLLDVDVNTIRFVLVCIDHAARKIPRRKGPKPHPNASEVCRAVRDVALAHFGNVNAARAGLLDLKLTRSEDVGRIVAAFVEAQLLGANADDSPADYRGLFTLDSLFQPGV
jgi:uncharacterized repeat protein (TIGR04138 family)